jgi:hypothetical protein
MGIFFCVVSMGLNWSQVKVVIICNETLVFLLYLAITRFYQVNTIPFTYHITGCDYLSNKIRISLMKNSMRNYHNLLDHPPPLPPANQCGTCVVENCQALFLAVKSGGGGHDEYWMKWSLGFCLRLKIHKTKFNLILKYSYIAGNFTNG